MKTFFLHITAIALSYLFADWLVDVEPYVNSNLSTIESYYGVVFAVTGLGYIGFLLICLILSFFSKSETSTLNVENISSNNIS